MSRKQLPEYAKRLVDQVATQNGFSDYLLQSNEGNKPGDGFSSELFAIRIVEENNNKQLDIVCKIAPSDENHRKEFFSSMVFERESAVYQKFLPMYYRFQDEKRVPEKERFTAYPKCYATITDDEHDHFAVILEDLRPHGFKMWNKAEPSPIRNVKLVMRELGKLHGLSFAVKDQKPEEFSKVKQTVNVFETSFKNESVHMLFKNTYDRAFKSLKDENHKKIVLDLKSNFKAYIGECLDAEALERFGILCHGDCWNNNILFRFNEKGVAEDIRFLDWQISHFSSPAIDLLYNIFTSTDKAFRDKEYENMLKCYHDSLCKTMRSLGSDPDELFTYDNLKDELRRCGNYPLVMVSMLLGVSLADSSNLTNLGEVFATDADKNKMDLITGFSDRGQNEFDRRINEVFEDIIGLGYYNKIK